MSFADGKTGAPANAHSRSLRTLFDGETTLLVRGEPIPVLDPTQVILPWQENMKGMVLGYGGCIVNTCASLSFESFPLLVAAAACGTLGFAWPSIWKHLPGATQPTFKRLQNGRGGRLE